MSRYHYHRFTDYYNMLLSTQINIEPKICYTFSIQVCTLYFINTIFIDINYFAKAETNFSNMQMKPKISITTQTYFEDMFYYSGWGFLVAAIPLLLIFWYVGIIAILLGVIIVTTSYKLVIDTTTNQVEDFLFFLGMKKNLKITHFKIIHHVTVKSGTYTQQLNLKSLSSTIRGTIYSAHLKTNEENLFLGESKSKNKITEKASRIAKELNVELKEL